MMVVDRIVNNLFHSDIEICRLEFQSEHDRVTYYEIIAIKWSSQLETFVRHGENVGDLFAFIRSKRMPSSEIFVLLNKPDYAREMISKRFGYKKIVNGPPRLCPERVYGLGRETEARERYQQLTGNKVRQYRHFVNLKFPWMLATPDGIVVHNGQLVAGLEIKSPKKNSYQTMYACMGQVRRNSAGQWYLTSDGPIYAQIQMCMAAANLKNWHLAVNFLDELIVIHVAFDRQFCEDLLARASKFYTSTYLPAISYYYWMYQLYQKTIK